MVSLFLRQYTSHLGGEHEEESHRSSHTLRSTPVDLRFRHSALPGHIVGDPAAGGSGGRGKRTCSGPAGQDWPLAVRYFSEARKAAPAAPQVIFNLALACDKAGGRDLPAVALYRACLASTPGAANAAQIQARVLELEVRAESDTIRLLQKAKEMYGLLPQQGLIFPSRSSFYADVVQVERALGRFAEAERSVSLIDDPNLRDMASRSPLEARIKAYDFEGALKILPRPHESPYNLQLYSGLVKTGQFERLREIAERIPDEGKKAEAYGYLFSALLGAGDLKGAAGLIEKIPPGSRPNGYQSLSQKRLQAGEFAGALDAAARAGEKFRVWLMLEVCEGTGQEGRRFGCGIDYPEVHHRGRRGAERCGSPGRPAKDASVQIDLGMKADALGTARKALAAVKKPSDSELSRICEVQAWAGDMEGARKTAEMFSEADRTRESPSKALGASPLCQCAGVCRGQSRSPGDALQGRAALPQESFFGCLHLLRRLGHGGCRG